MAPTGVDRPTVIPIAARGYGAVFARVRQPRIIGEMVGGCLLFSCLVNTVSVYGGARLGGQPSGAALNLAVTMKARGGRGKVVASVGLAAGIVNRSFNAVRGLLTAVRTLVAGSWLRCLSEDRVLASHPHDGRNLPSPPTAQPDHTHPPG